MRRFRQFAFAALIPLWLCSCTSTPQSSAVSSPAHAHAPSLVMRSPAMQMIADDDTIGWEARRNDTPSIVESTPEHRDLRWMEVRHREHLRTINGRPGEFSASSTKTLQRRQVR